MPVLTHVEGISCGHQTGWIFLHVLRVDRGFATILVERGPIVAPTSTSIMSGRYAWRTGFYDMVNDAGHVLDANYSMLPKLLAANGYISHAIGSEDLIL